MSLVIAISVKFDFDQDEQINLISFQFKIIKVLIKN
jgi:hypothetical protein